MSGIVEISGFSFEFSSHLLLRTDSVRRYSEAISMIGGSFLGSSFYFMACALMYGASFPSMSH